MPINPSVRCRSRHLHSAWTMVELIVAMSIIGTLVSLLLPAVQHARESSRAITCQSNLRQLAIAGLEFESRHRRFPVGVDHKYALLPSLEQSAVYQAKLSVDPNNITAQWDSIKGLVLPIFLCPSDPSDTKHADQGGTNYYGNAGTGVLADGFNGIFGHGEGEIPGDVKEGVTAAMIRDGLSHTAAFSEAIRWGTTERLTQTWLLPQTRWDASDQPAMATECDSIPVNPNLQAYWHSSNPRGYPWYGGGIGVALYNHILTPNRPSCINGMEAVSGIYTATSHHTGRVHVAFCDGHVVAIDQHIDAELWQALGSRDANDIGL